MNWKHTKTFLIILLAAVNILLCVYVLGHFNDNYFVGEEEAQEACNALKNSGIYVDASLLGGQNDNAGILICTYDREEYISLVASVLFGKEADGIYMLPTSVRAETKEGDVAVLGYDMSIDYVMPEITEDIDGILESAVVLSDADSKKDRKKLEQILALPSGSLDGAECKKSGDYVFISAYQTENNIPIYDMSCVFGVLGDRIVYAKGKHFFSIPVDKQDTPILNRINIMFSEKKRGAKGKVNAITFCYTLYENALSKSMMLVPSYAVEYDDGTVNAVNAVSKELYEN